VAKRGIKNPDLLGGGVNFEGGGGGRVKRGSENIWNIRPSEEILGLSKKKKKGPRKSWRGQGLESRGNGKGGKEKRNVQG